MVIYEDHGKNAKGVALTKAYSDAGYYIERDGIEYTEAIDPTDAGRKYNETDIPIDADDTEAYAEAGKILMGVIE